MTVDVVVAGAGVGGLAAARALSAIGLRVVVLDRQRVPVDVAKGELLQPESVRILEGWGALPALREAGAVPVDRLAIRDTTGRALMKLDYGVLPGPHRMILCTEYGHVLRALADSLDPAVEVRRGALVVDALRDGRGRITGVRVVEGARRYDLPATLVVAADGLSSKLRKAAGLTARRDEYAHRLLALDVPGADVDAEVTAYTTDRGLRLVYPLPGNRARVYLQVRPDEFRGTGTAELSGWIGDVLDGVPALHPIADAVRASLPSRQLLAVHRLRARRLTAPGLALVGEAAHAVHPMAAQGMNSSLADAESLAAQLADSASVDGALRGYHAVRLGRLDHTATVSHNAARMLTGTTGTARALGRRLMRNTAANPRLLHITTGNMSGVVLRPLTPLDRLYQLGLLRDPRSAGVPTSVAPTGEAR